MYYAAIYQSISESRVAGGAVAGGNLISRGVTGCDIISIPFSMSCSNQFESLIIISPVLLRIKIIGLSIAVTNS